MPLRYAGLFAALVLATFLAGCSAGVVEAPPTPPSSPTPTISVAPTPPSATSTIDEVVAFAIDLRGDDPTTSNAALNTASWLGRYAQENVAGSEAGSLRLRALKLKLDLIRDADAELLSHHLTELRALASDVRDAAQR